MKFTVMGFNQQAILDINESSSHKLDVTDLLLLRWLVDFSQTEKMTKTLFPYRARRPYSHFSARIPMYAIRARRSHF